MLQYFPELLSIYNPKNNANETVLVNGAAIQCASWEGVSLSDLQSLLYIDLLPHDICIEMEDGSFDVVIPQGVTVPAKKTIEVVLEDPEQKSLTLTLYRKKEQDYVVG